MTTQLLLEIALKSTAVLMAAWIATWFLKRSSAALRHFVWTVAFFSILVLPFVVLFGPAWRIALLPERTHVNVEMPAQPPNEFAGSVARDIKISVTPATTHEFARRLAVENHFAFPTPTIAQILTGLWAAGTILIVLKLTIGLLWAARIARRATEINNPTWTALVSELSTALRLKRHVPVLQTDQTSIASTCGILHPLVLVPLESERWARHRTRFVLLHELAHVKRRDCLVQTLARLSWALHWFNPIALVAAGRMSVEQERACDDLVLEAGTRAPEYAKELLEMAHSFRPGALPAWASLSMARPSQFAERLAAILDQAKTRRAPAPEILALVALVVCLFVMPLGAARLVPRTSPAVAQAPAKAVPAPPSPQASPQPRVVPMRLVVIQAGAAELGGTVADASGARLPSVTVSVRGASGITRAVLSNESGEYRLTGLEPGTYQVWAELIGFKTQNFNGASLARSQRALLNFTLQPGEGTESASIGAALPPLPPQGQGPPPPPRPVGAPRRIRVGGNVAASNLVHQIAPVYPAQARDAGVEGVVALEVEITTEGKVNVLRAVAGHPLLIQAATDAVKQYLYRPMMLGEQHVSAVTTVTLTVANRHQQLSLEKEIELGRQLSNEVTRNVEIVSDAAINEYLNDVGQSLIRSSDGKTAFTFKAVKSAEVNAFGLPGGHLFVNTGLILAADNESELAAVISHLVAHVAAHHATENASQGKLVNFASIPLVFLGGGPAGYGLRQASGFLIPMQYMKFERAHEMEADYLGLQYLYKAGYDLNAKIRFFEKLQVLEGAKPGATSAMFSTHPPTTDRIEATRKNIAILGARDGAIVTTPRFAEIKTRVASLN